MNLIETKVTGDIILYNMQSGGNSLKYLNQLKALKSVNILLEQGEVKLETPLEDEKVTKLIPYILISKNVGIMRTKAARKYIPEDVTPEISSSPKKKKTQKKTNGIGEEKKVKPGGKIVTFVDKNKGKNPFKFQLDDITGFTCGECQTLFQRNVDLQLHLLKHIQKKRPFVKLYSYNLPKHFKTYENEDMYLKPRAKTSVNSTDTTIDINPVNTDVNSLLPNEENCLENVIIDLENNLEELCLRKENIIDNQNDLDLDENTRKRKSILVNSPKENSISPTKKVRFSSEKIVMCNDNSISRESIDDQESIYEDDDCPDLDLTEIEEDVNKGVEFFEELPKISSKDKE